MSANEKVFSVLLAPRVSEKTARLQEVSNQYVFEVSSDATKADVKAAVEQLFDVKVESVNVVQVKGKVRDTLEVPADITAEDLEARARASQKVRNFIGDAEIVKVIVREPKLVNLVIR